MLDKRVEQAVKFMEDVANDNSHGYDQIYRWNEKGDYDCSSLTITAFEKAGFPVKSKYGSTYTGDMKQAFVKCGFKDVAHLIKSSSDLLRGDILLNENYHVAVYLGSGMLVQASINEKGTATYGKAGDQTGKEINISPYYVYKKGGWNCILRLPDLTQGKLQNISKPQIKPTTKINIKGDTEMVEIIKIKSNGKTPTVSAINKNGNYFVKLRDLDTLGLLKVSYDKENKIPVIDKVK